MMTTREQFGPYLLLKKLTEDSLGEAFRAGRTGGQGLEQVALLRVFNGPRIDIAKLRESLPDRRPVQEALKSPNIGNGIDLGEVRGIPFVAYDYISGMNLASVLAEITQKRTYLPLDHALLIAERIALGLTVAFEARLGGERLSHGYLVPQLVMISSEGEIRLLGFEAAPALREMAGSGAVEPDVASYLAPELRAGAGPAVSDDVYSLGSILFEMLTGHKVPTSGVDPSSLVAGARVEAEGTPLPPSVASLLEKSLAPREQRISDVVTWHKSLSKAVIEGQHGATTFNLAFFMHNLFRSEIERETQEIETEKTLSLPREELAAAVEEARAEPVGDDTTAHEDETTLHAAPKRSKTGLWIGLAAAVVVAALGIGYLLLQRSPSGSLAPQQAPTEVAPAQPEPAPPKGPTPEELEAQLTAQLNDLLEARSKELEDRLAKEYDSQIQGLRRQLQESRTAAEARQVELERQQKAAAEAAEATPTTPDPKAAETRPAESATDVAAKAEPTKVDEPTAGTTTSPVATDRLAEARPTPTETATTSPPPPPAPSRTSTAAAEPRASAPQNVAPMRVAAPQLISELDPRYPPMARRMNKEATVEMRVLVSTTGDVVRVEQISPKAGFGIDQAALEAARKAKFKPGTRNGKPAEMWYLLKLQFKP